MDLARPVPEPTATVVANDRERVRYAVVGAMALLAGIWVAWGLAWLLGWPLDSLGVRPRQFDGLIGILTAPFAHASFDHLMSNTLPLALLATLTLYCYPRAARLALPAIWLASGLAVWLFARSSTHVGASGIAHGLMFFLFVMGLLRRDRLAVVVSLVVFFLYGGMLMTVLPREANVSFEYHLAGAVAGLIAAVLLRARDPLPPRKRYSWEDEEAVEPLPDEELELPRAANVPVLWQRRPEDDQRGRVIVFRPRPREDSPPTVH
ncbi:rhomboid family intramembrane serine protease [Dokdonella sp.]|uniref:rhomboid family intramembrane serine protease n=1 Tax=Dokdonella sp. TaxID=2291710 RepID=UPI001B2A3E7C|nr:rhomboid family intramembrane serine protease [Dokdonella sp.]MBO9661507.1 rhomboid family intramembrane serine protease [Dokdonella sp.]